MKKFLAGLTALALTATLAGCSNTPGDPASSGGPALDSSVPEVTTPSTQAPPDPDLLNPLTGEYNLVSGGDRPVAVMIGNNDKSRPQPGIDQADMYMEVETEGGITRIMAVFSNASRVPDQLGPVRSARTPFVSVALAMDLIYCHAGGSNTALDAISKSDMDNINALVYDGTTFWRDATLKKEKGTEYSMLVSGKNLVERMEKLKYSTAADRTAPFTFGEKAGSGAGDKVQLNVSGNRIVSFTYDGDTGLYTKQNGALEKGNVHKSAEGRPITASNVLILYADKYMESSDTCNFKMSSGEGILVSGGSSRDIRYSVANSGMKFTETDGTAMISAPGKTYICLVDSKLKGKTSLS